MYAEYGRGILTPVFLCIVNNTIGSVPSSFKVNNKLECPWKEVVVA
jgi:hypothetical protein